MLERDTGRSKGFGFVEMSSDEEAQKAITGAHADDSSLSRSLVVREVKPRPPPPTQRRGRSTKRGWGERGFRSGVGVY